MIGLLFLALASAEAPFEPSTESFADAAACEARLAGLASDARGGGYDAVEGPYEITAGDVRLHFVRAEGPGHRISEHRCLAEKLSGRSWTHAMADAAPEFTIESVARTAPWLQKNRSEK